MPVVVLSVSQSRSISFLSTPANLADASNHSDQVLVDVLRSMLEGSGLGAITRDNLIGETILSLATTLDCDPKDLTATYTDIRVTFRAYTGAIPTLPSFSRSIPDFVHCFVANAPRPYCGRAAAAGSSSGAT